ncbi:MAG TPA: hypothetical protein VE954_43105 [Oligoflexus sp.]|uniref:phage adaptor protein n=1 Tax=Oligoflexus sp. TaxID=1971216 RepID=UPI002D28DED9|nr:hypothetical protein [Oligoflexus sp.]HYX39933.1 hypothetical protein [Oligoflexus sp.]
MAEAPWTLSRLIDEVKDDLELHQEDFVTTRDLIKFVRHAIEDAQDIVIGCYSDFLKTFADFDVTAGQTVLDLPEDIYDSRMRGFYYSDAGWDDPASNPYKIRKMRDVQAYDGEAYRYDLINSSTDGQQLYIYPAITEASDNKFRLWYIRKFNIPTAMSDVLDKGLRVQYLLSHVKCAVMLKEGDPMYDSELAKLTAQQESMKMSLSSLTDDDENTILEPDDYALSMAGYDE